MADMITGPVFHKLLRRREEVDEAYLTAVVNLVVLGAIAGGAVRARALVPQIVGRGAGRNA
jgi:hypothetical protein